MPNELGSLRVEPLENSPSTRATIFTADERSQEIDRGGGTGDPLMILRAGFGTFWSVVGCGCQFREIQLGEKPLSAEENTEMWSVKFISRTSEEIAIHRPDVDQLVWRVMHSIDEKLRSHGMYHFAGASDVSDAAKRV